ncbi:MAG: 3'-5' exoribonuclease domain-containing protein [Acidithiobacillus ferrivorans]
MVDIDTIEWWIEQTLEARNAVFHGPCAHSVAAGLGKFSRFLQRIPGERLRLWSNGPAFDSAQLQLYVCEVSGRIGSGHGLAGAV